MASIMAPTNTDPTAAISARLVSLSTGLVNCIFSPLKENLAAKREDGDLLFPASRLGLLHPKPTSTSANRGLSPMQKLPVRAEARQRLAQGTR